MNRSVTAEIGMFCALLLLTAQVSLAGVKDSPSSGDTKEPKTESPATSQGAGSDGVTAVTWPGIDLPAYKAPDAYSVDLVIDSPEGRMVMKQSVDKGRTRTDLNADGHDMVMIETGDEKGTMLMLMPEEKRAIKTSSAMMPGMAEQMAGKKAEEEAETAPPDMKIEDLGDEALDGRMVKKLRMSFDEGSALGWFDKTTGAPLRLESTVDGKKTAMEWKNYTVEPQPENLFEVPKSYELMDMEQMMSQAKGMGGNMSGMMGAGGLMGVGAGGMAGMAGGMAGNMASGMAQNFGQSMGGSLGATLGGALGGPIGSIAGQYIGGKIGRMIGKKVAKAVIPGQ
jgi:hypothetical protein